MVRRRGRTRSQVPRYRGLLPGHLLTGRGGRAGKLRSPHATVGQSGTLSVRTARERMGCARMLKAHKPVSNPARTAILIIVNLSR